MQKKNIFYQLILISIFFISLLISVKPVVGYKLGVPDIAEHAEFYSEVKIYDTDEWNDHLGSGASNPDDIFYGDADEIGAKEKIKIVEWVADKKRVDFFEDNILTREVEFQGAPEVATYEDAIDYTYNNIQDLVKEDIDTNAVLEVYLATLSTLGGFPPGSLEHYVIENGTLANSTCVKYSINRDYVIQKYAEVFNGTILIRKYWEFTTGEFKEKPDDKNFEVSIFNDPSSWYENYILLALLNYEILTEVDKVIESITEFERSLALLKFFSIDNWKLVNDTCKTGLEFFEKIVPDLDEGGDDLPRLMLEASLDPSGLNPLQEGKNGLLLVEPNFGAIVPGKFGFLYNLLSEGIPIYTPGDKYLKAMVKEFDFDENNVETGIPGLNPNLQVKGDVVVNGRVITLKFRYPKGTVDPDDPANELEDFEIQYTYNDMGFQESVIYKDGDDIFYEKSSLPLEMVIFGFPLYTIITVGTIGFSVFVIGLIYVISRRKRKKI